MNYSENIKKYRKKKGFTQAQLAEALDVKPSSVSAWELGRNKPLMDKVQLMANIFDITVSDLIGDTFINDLELNEIYVQLEDHRRTEVVDFAKFKLYEQTAEKNKDEHAAIYKFEKENPTDKEIDTIAASSRNPNKKVTKEELDRLNEFLDEVDEEARRKEGKYKK